MLKGAHAVALHRGWPILGYTKKGKPVFPIAGGDGSTEPPEGGAVATIPTITELRDERGRVLGEIDGLFRTAHEDGERAFTADEFAEHERLVARSGELDGQIEAAHAVQRTGDARSAHEQRLRLASVRVSAGADTPAANRSLDELLWATNEHVPAGTMSRSGVFAPNAYGALNPVEALVVRNADGDLDQAPRLSEFRPEHQEVIRSFQRTVADMILFGFMVDKTARSSAEAFEASKSDRRMGRRWDHVLRAMDLSDANEGKDYVPTGLGGELHEKVRAMGKVAPLFPVINLPTNPWELPIEGADASAYLVAEPTSDTASKVTASTPGSKKVQFHAEIFGGRVLFSKGLDQDSAIAVLPYVRGKLVRAFSIGEEKAILDGDTAGTHQDGDVTVATDPKKAWNGLRKRGIANANTDMANAVITTAKFNTARQAMGKYGLNPADVVAIVGVKGYYELLSLAEVLTVDKFGPQATILNGQLGALSGIPLVVSEYVREDLNAAGVQDGVTTNRSYLILVNRGEWAMGQRMTLDIEVDDSIYRESFQRVVVGFMREDFQNVGDASTNADTAILRNIA